MRLKNRMMQLYRALLALGSMEKRLELIQESLGRIEARQVEQVTRLNDAEFRVFSQWGEDGIIQYLLGRLPGINKSFIEFGVEDYFQANTRFLVKNNYWRGLVIDGSRRNIELINRSELRWAHGIKARCEFITRDNINGIIRDEGFGGEIGVLSIDIDGNDYWVWEQISCVEPIIVVCEYNALFGPTADVSTIYRSDFIRSTEHYSQLLYGASISALTRLADEKGYHLVGSNSAGNNLFFVHQSHSGAFEILDSADAYRFPTFRESIDEGGRLSYLEWVEMIELIGDSYIFDFSINRQAPLRDALTRSPV